MSFRSKAGWIAAAVLALAWYGSAKDRASVPSPERPAAVRELPAAPPPSAVEKPSVVAIHRPAVEIDPAMQLAGAKSVPLFAKSRVRLRSQPNTKAPVLLTLETGQRVEGQARDGAWRQVIALNLVGWVHGDYLSEEEPAPPARVVAPPTPIVKRSAKPAPRTGEPLRGAYTGTCDCPYDRMRNGRRCGGNSAYSRPGGREPACYVGE